MAMVPILLVCAVNEGLAKEWNMANPDRALKIDHKIIAVNDTKGDSAAMADVIRNDHTLEFTVRTDFS